MNYEDKIRGIIRNMDMGESIFNIKVTKRRIDIGKRTWRHNLNLDDFAEQLIASYENRKFNFESKKYEIDEKYMLNNINNYVMHSIITIFIRCSPYAQPRRTKAYKDFEKVIISEEHNMELKKNIFDIYEYYWNNTRTDSIEHSNNDVHRKNVYQLLCLMEKSYGKKTSN